MKSFSLLFRGVGTVKFPVKQLKRIPDKFANLLNFLHFQPLISGEAAASPASPVPTPLTITPINFSGPSFIDGTLSYVYDTDTDESTGTWDDWEQSSGCSRTCGGGILIGKSVACISKS